MARAMADGRRGVRALCSERGPWRSVLTIRAARDCSERHDRRRVRWTASSWEQLQLGVLQPNARRWRTVYKYSSEEYEKLSL